MLNRSWQSALTPTLLQCTATGPKPPVGILLDPPYRTDTGRDPTIYASDADGSSDDAATASYRWALDHGDKWRIAYCCHEGDFAVPAGWDTHIEGFKGINKADRRVTQNDLVHVLARMPEAITAAPIRC